MLQLWKLLNLFFLQLALMSIESFWDHVTAVNDLSLSIYKILDFLSFLFVWAVKI